MFLSSFDRPNLSLDVRRGLAGSVMVGAAGLTVANPSRPKLDALKADFPEMKVTTDNVQAVADADFVILPKGRRAGGPTRPNDQRTTGETSMPYRLLKQEGAARAAPPFCISRENVL